MEGKHDWNQVIETALTLEGSVGQVYSRCTPYSFGNTIRLMLQGVREPCASFKGWQALGRQVVRGAKGYEIIRPITVKKRGSDEDETFTKFKPVRGAFALSDTVGEELPPLEVPGWSLEKMLGTLAIEQVPFDLPDLNCQGFARGRSISVSPVAVYPLKTTLHECSHVQLGHTDGETIHEYASNRGIREFQAEASAHITMTELELMDEEQASVSRGYIQGWLREERPGDTAVRQVFTAVESLLRAGRLAVGEVPA